MKIDLHIHTMNIAKGDTDKRVIDPESFKEKMEQSNVGIAAITNHNHFIAHEFIKFKSEPFLLLPGVEIDVLYKGKRKQLNYILGPERECDLEKLVSDHLSSTSAENPIDFDEFIKNFDEDKAIIYFDFKSGDTKWSDNEIYDLKNAGYKSVALFDASNAKTHTVLMAHNFNTLIGSDVLDWDLYLEENAPKLIDTPLPINSYNFDKLIKILKYDPTVFSFLNSTRRKMADLSDLRMLDSKGEFLDVIKDLNIYEGVNVIFGPKATGKTAILDAISAANVLNSAIYKSSNMLKKYDELIKPTAITNDETIIASKIIDDISEIKSFKKKPFIHFKKFKTASMTSGEKIKIHKTRIDDVSIPGNLKSLIQLLSSLDKYIFSLHENKDLPNYKQLVAGADKARADIANYIIVVEKPYKLFSLKKTIHKEISKILIDKKGSETEPNEIGLLAEFKQRKQILDLIMSVKKSGVLVPKEISKVIIPDKDTLIITRVFSTLPFEIGSVKKTDFKNKALFHEFVKLFKLTINSSTKEIEDAIAKHATAFKNDLDSIVLIKNQLSTSDGKTYSPSNGEKALLALTDVLNKDKNIFLLDEPAVYLGSKMVTESLLPKIAELKKQNKTVIITTHQASVGLNSMPNNLIYRRNNATGTYETFQGNFLDETFSNLDGTKTIPFKGTVVENFEGGIKHFSFRKDIYEY